MIPSLSYHHFQKERINNKIPLIHLPSSDEQHSIYVVTYHKHVSFKRRTCYAKTQVI